MCQLPGTGSIVVGWVSTAHTCVTFGIRLFFIRLCFTITDLTTRIVIHCWMWPFTCAGLLNRFGHILLLWSWFVILRKSIELMFSCNRTNMLIMQRKFVSVHFPQTVNFLQTFDINPNRLWGKSNQEKSRQRLHSGKWNVGHAIGKDFF